VTPPEHQVLSMLAALVGAGPLLGLLVLTLVVALMRRAGR
jgi:hypothetical protein